MLTECIIMAAAGLIMIIIGIISISHDAFYLPWFTRSKVADEHLNQYAKGMGTGSLLIGLGIVGTALTRIFIHHELVWLIAAIGCSAGLVAIGFAYFIYGRCR